MSSSSPPTPPPSPILRVDNAPIRRSPPPERAEEEGKKNKEKGWVRKLWPWLANHKKDVFLAFGVAIVGMVIAALTPVVEKIVLDDITLHPKHRLWPWLVLLLIAGVIRFGAAFVRRYFG